MKIYHLCPSGSLWIFNQKEVESREKGEALFQKQAKPGDVLKIEIPGQDVIKIVKIININKPMGNKKSQLGIHAKDQKKDILKEQEDYNQKAPKFFEEYTALTDKYGLFLNAQLEFGVDGVRPKIVVQVKPAPIPTAPVPDEEEPKGEAVAA
jgi:hypothetical protein